MSAVTHTPGRRTPAVLPMRSLRQTRAVARLGRVTLVALSVLAAYGADRGLGPAGLAAVMLLTGTWLAALQLGRMSAPEPLGPLVATAVGGLAGLVLVPATAVWLPIVDLSSARAFVMTVAVLASVGVWDSVVHRTTAGRRRVLVVGSPRAADAVADETARGSAHVDVLGLVPERAEPQAECHVPVVGELDALADVVAELAPDVVVVADGMDCDAAVDHLLDVPDDRFRIIGYTSFFEHALGRVPVSTLRASWFMSLLHLRQRCYARWAKRAFDVAAASAALVLAAPIMAVVALLLRPSGPVLYRQTRLGERGRRFMIVKFRTMRVDAEALGGAVWWSGESDPRVTRLGRVLRRAHLDELPQLVNVLRGDMSMVGPRPERPEFVELLEREVPFWNRRLLVKPGVTGWAQLKGGYASDCEAMAEKLSYDLWYLRNRTVLVDVAICLATALQMVAVLIPGLRHAGADAAPEEAR